MNKSMNHTLMTMSFDQTPHRGFDFAKQLSMAVSLFGVFLLLAFLVLAAGALAQAEIAPEELVAPELEISGGNLNFTVRPSVSGRTYQLQYSETMAEGTWQDLGVVRVGDGNNLVIVSPHVPSVTRCFYRLLLSESPPVSDGFALIPAGSFTMGQTGIATPEHTVYVSAFYLGKYEVTWLDWRTVRDWAVTNGYTDLSFGAGTADTHPVHSIGWWDVVKWCNARSQKENLTPCYTVSGSTYKTGSSTPDCNWNASGYRLPSEAEWEKAARGGLRGKNFPWGDTITHSQANYYSSSSLAYDVSPTRGFHPSYAVGDWPYSSPVGSFAPNGYGLYDMEGNMSEWCWDWYGDYAAGSQTDPRGAASGSYRVIRGGCWIDLAFRCRVACRYSNLPSNIYRDFGFRLARSSVP